jgi:hypothetical protein
MQAKTDTVIVRGADGKPLTLENVNTLMGNLGLFIKSEDKLEMYVWENILYMKWTDLQSRTSVWEEAMAELIAEAFDDDEWDDEEEFEAPAATTPAEVPTPQPQEPKTLIAKIDETIVNDDSELDPYTP